ncbi:uncharacterized protein LOC128883180 isoform X2 [Hylaeus volcanicus]|uniref:uncharacterized protein LOC128883180 isoform X2 n=1 Tax=Hylaeus volcanicus TaxID=313075 RepID=UPI0023B7C6C5|nr:uncharacterized protein LOC128883180 isoform X2 [Hylaeus volcanicus]
MNTLNKNFIDKCVCDCHSVTCDKNTENNHSTLEFPTCSSELNDSIIKNFQLCDTRRDNFNLISSIDWDQSGDCLLSCSRNNTITLHNISCKSVRQFYSKKYGAHGARFLHGGESCCIVAAKTPDNTKNNTVSQILNSLCRTTWDVPSSQYTQFRLTNDQMLHQKTRPKPDPPAGSLKYWDLRENRFVSNFFLRSAVSLQAQLSVSLPPNELICAPCMDGTVQFFNVTKKKPMAILETGMTSSVHAFLEQKGNVAAVQILPFTIQLLDFRKSFEKAHYMSIDVTTSLHKSYDEMKSLCITNIQLSQWPCLTLLVTLVDIMGQPTLLEYDAQTGELLHRFYTSTSVSTQHLIERWKCDPIDPLSYGRPIQFSPHISRDGRYIACGCGAQSTLAFWSTKSDGLPIKTLSTGTRVARQVQWNPTQMLLASAYDHLAFWGPLDSYWGYKKSKNSFG